MSRPWRRDGGGAGHGRVLTKGHLYFLTVFATKKRLDHHDTRLKRLCCTNRFEVVLPLKLYIQLPAFALSPTLKQGTSAHA